MHISVTIFTGSSVLNVWLVSEYVPQISFFKFRFWICSRIFVSSCYGLNTATFKMELYVTIVNGFYVLNATCHLLQYFLVSYFYRTFLHVSLVVFCRIVKRTWIFRCYGYLFFIYSVLRGESFISWSSCCFLS